MTKYKEAAKKIAKLADQYKDCEEVCKHLKNASSKIANLETEKTPDLKLVSDDHIEI